MTIAKEVRRTVAKTKTLQKRLVEYQEGITKNIKLLEDMVRPYIVNRLADVFPGLEFAISTGFYAGCHTTDWKPVIYFGRVGWCEYWQGKWYDSCTGDERPAPLSVHKFRKFLKQLGSEVGVPCYYSSPKPASVSVKEMTSKKHKNIYSYPSPYEPNMSIRGA